jgi:hypothetical protein
MISDSYIFYAGEIMCRLVGVPTIFTLTDSKLPGNKSFPPLLGGIRERSNIGKNSFPGIINTQEQFSFPL